MSTSGMMNEVRIGVRLKISALWVTVLLLFAYGDIFGFFAPGHIEEIVAGEISGIEITEGFLLAVSVYIAIASAMVFLTLCSRRTWRDGRTSFSPSCTSCLSAAVGEASAYYVFLSAAEIAALALIVRYAWSWPREDASAA